MNSKPKIKIKYGESVFGIISRARRYLRKAGYTDEQVQKYLRQVRSGDYDKAIEITKEWMNVVQG